MVHGTRDGSQIKETEVGGGGKTRSRIAIETDLDVQGVGDTSFGRRGGNPYDN